MPQEKNRPVRKQNIFLHLAVNFGLIFSDTPCICSLTLNQSYIFIHISRYVKVLLKTFHYYNCLSLQNQVCVDTPTYNNIVFEFWLVFYKQTK